jgi:hypothetical protein
MKNFKIESSPFGVIVPPIPEKDIYGTIEKIYEIDNSILLDFRQRAFSKYFLIIS